MWVSTVIWARGTSKVLSETPRKTSNTLWAYGAPVEEEKWPSQTPGVPCGACDLRREPAHMLWRDLVGEAWDYLKMQSEKSISHQQSVKEYPHWEKSNNIPAEDYHYTNIKHN